jgi:excisionase family DNA binding protein
MPKETARKRGTFQHVRKERRAAVRDTAHSEIDQLYEALRKANAKLIGPSGEARLLPKSLYAFLVDLFGLLNKGKSVLIVQNQAKLTTVEAASLLGVSRQFLVNLLERGEIPYHMVGTHRRIYAQDLFRFRAARDAARHKLIRELAQAEAAEGLYGRTAQPSPDED